MGEFRSDHHRSNGGGDRNLEIVKHGEMNGPRLSEADTWQSNRASSRGSTSNNHYYRKSKVVDSGSMVSTWNFNDPEMKRRKRVVKYKAYAVEGKLKSSFGRGFRWIRNKCSEIVHGY